MVASATMYVGGSWGITVSGKYLGTKGAGPAMCGESSEAFVWSDSWSRASLFAAKCRLRMMLRARPRENNPKTPTLPPTAAAKVSTLCFLVFLQDVRTSIIRRRGASDKRIADINTIRCLRVSRRAWRTRWGGGSFRLRCID